MCFPGSKASIFSVKISSKIFRVHIDQSNIEKLSKTIWKTREYMHKLHSRSYKEKLANEVEGYELMARCTQHPLQWVYGERQISNVRAPTCSSILNY